MANFQGWGSGSPPLSSVLGCNYNLPPPYSLGGEISFLVKKDNVVKPRREVEQPQFQIDCVPLPPLEYPITTPKLDSYRCCSYLFMTAIPVNDENFTHMSICFHSSETVDGCRINSCACSCIWLIAKPFS